MAKIAEWFKGVGIFVVTTFMFYFLWSNFFKGIIDFVIAEDSIMGTFVWISYIVLYFTCCPLYLLFCMVAGSRDGVETSPLDILKAIGAWSIFMPIMIFIYQIVDSMTTALNDANILETSLETTAMGYSWLIALIIVIILTLLPFYYVLKGYGQLSEEEMVDGR